MALNRLEGFQNAYDSYITQLKNNKTSAINAVNSSTEKAKALLNNRLKSQGIDDSGMGLSRYTSLANQNSANVASAIQNYNDNYATATKDFENQKQSYLDSYNNQIKNEAQTVLGNMTNEQAQAYINELKGNTNVYDDTTSYLDKYLQGVQNSKSAEALSTAKSELANFDSYEGMQDYINSLNNLTPEQKTSLENYASALGYGWETTKESYANQLADTMKAIGSSNSNYGKLYSAYQQLVSAKSKEDFDRIMKEQNVKGLLDSVETGRNYLDAYSNFPNLKNGDTVNVDDLKQLRDETGLVWYNTSTNEYQTIINGQTYTFDSNGKLLEGGSNGAKTPNTLNINNNSNENSVADLKIGNFITPEQLKILKTGDYEVGNGQTTFNYNGYEIVVRQKNGEILSIKEKNNNRTIAKTTSDGKPSGMPTSEWEKYKKALQKI